MATKFATELNFLNIQVRDLEKSKMFYAEVLGFKVEESPNPDAVVFKSNSGAIFVIRKPMVDLEAVTSLGWGVSPWFGVDDIDSYYKEVEFKAMIIRELQETPFVKTFVVADHDGYLITIQQKRS
jgi:predicted enzyme related to lactoylglutathione lyase